MQKETPVIPTKSAFAAAAAVAALLASVQASAQSPDPVFAAFAAVCGQPAGEFTAIQSAADAHGWAATDVKDDPNMPNVVIAEQITRASTVGKIGLVMNAWHGATKSGVKVSGCTVHVAAADFGGMRDAAGAWLTFTPQESTAKKAIYRFTNAAGAHHALAASEYDAAAAASGMQILTVSGDADGTVLDLIMIKK